MLKILNLDVLCCYGGNGIFLADASLAMSNGSGYGQRVTGNWLWAVMPNNGL
jgi:hypothetical protein